MTTTLHPAPSPWPAFRLAGLALLLMLSAHQLLVFGTTYDAGRWLNPLYSFTALYPACYVLGLSRAFSRPFGRSLLNAVAALGLMFMASVGVSVAAVIFGLLTIGFGAIPAIPAAGAAYGLLLGALQQRMFGYPEMPYRPTWRLINGLSGMLAAPAIMLGTGVVISWLTPGSTSFTSVRRVDPVVTIAVSILLPWIVGLIHLALAFSKLDYDLEHGARHRPEENWPQMLRALGILASLPVLGWVGITAVKDYQKLPPRIVADRAAAIHFYEQPYYVTKTDVLGLFWNQKEGRPSRLQLAYEAATDGTIVTATEDNERAIYLQGAGNWRMRTVRQVLHCHQPAIFPYAECWTDGQKERRERLGRWTPPKEPVFPMSVDLPIAASDWELMLLIDKGQRYRANLIKLPGNAENGQARFRLIVPHGGVWWMILLTEDQLPVMEKIIANVQALQQRLSTPLATVDAH
jgi:hypothetical protein